MDVDEQGQDVTPNKDGGVMKHVKRAGIGDLHPSTGDTVNVHYVGTLADNGKQFDSSRDRKEPFNFVLGRGQVIKGWDLGVAAMKKGELAVLTCRADYAYGEKGSGEKIPPGATLNFEVELLSWSGEDISPDRDGSITRSIHVEGEKYSTPSECAPVKVYAVGKANGRTFYDRHVDFVLGEGSEQGLPDGVEKALRRMTKGETAHIHIKGSQFTYGNNAPKEFNLSPYAELDWILTLKDHEKVKANWELTGDEKLVAAEEAKNKGNAFLKEGKYRLALTSYKRIEDLLEYEKTLDGDKKKQRESLLVAGYLNGALVNLKQSETSECIKLCGKALEIDANNAKAIYRRAQARQQQNDLADAIADYRLLLTIEPNQAAQQQIAICKQKADELQKRERATFAGMFDRIASKNQKAEVDASERARKKAFPDSKCGAEVEAGTL